LAQVSGFQKIYNIYVTNITLFVIAVGFVFGVFVESILRIGPSQAFFLFVLGGAIFLAQKIISKNDFADQKKFYVAIFLLSMALGSLRLTVALPQNFTLESFIDKKINIEGLIVEEEDRRESQTFLTVEVGRVGKVLDEKIISEIKKSRTKILVKTAEFQRFSYGDGVLIGGTLGKPKSFETKGGGEFDYASYLEKDGILYIVGKASVEKISEGGGSSVKRILFSVKNKFIDSLRKNINEPEVSLLSGLVVGGKQSLGKEWTERFQRTGVMHIVVLSGYNITIVASSVIKFFGIFLSSAASMFIGVLAIILFAIMTGGSATVVRATIMAIIALLARYTKRRYAVTRALIIAAVLMVVHNPLIVVFDPSFQLSFMATIALVYVSPLVESKAKFITEKFHVREIVVSTIATQIFVLPLLLHMTGNFSVVALPVNLLILGFIPLTMFYGFLAGMIGIVFSAIALPFAYLAYALLFYEMKIVELFSAVPFASFSLSVFPIWLVFITYALMIYGLYVWHSRKQLKNAKL